MPNINTIKKNSFTDPGKNVPAGARFIDPEAVIGDMDMKTGMNVADFGCGTGYFSLPLAKAVGKEGIICALDILPSKLESVRSQAKLLGLNNIKTRISNLEIPEGSKLEKETMDWVILVNMLFQNNKSGRTKIIQEAKRVLKRGGFLLVIEWNELESSIGPDKKIRISKEEMIRMARENGLGILKELKVGNFHYGMILAKYK